MFERKEENYYPWKAIFFSKLSAFCPSQFHEGAGAV